MKLQWCSDQHSVELYHGDCLDMLDKIMDNSVDMVLVDPPYGTTACKWDSMIPLDQMWKQLKRIIKPNCAIVMTASQPFTTNLISSNINMFRYCWVWDKHIARNFVNAKRMPMQKHEDVVVFGENSIHYYPLMIKRDKPVTVRNYSKTGKDSAYKLNQDGSNRKTYTYTHKHPDTIIIGCWEANRGKVHPTQKPVSLMEYLIKTYTKVNGTVLDFAMGSGTTGVASVKSNRKFIGIEIDQHYCDIAVNRIKAELSKTMGQDKMDAD